AEGTAKPHEPRTFALSHFRTHALTHSRTFPCVHRRRNPHPRARGRVLPRGRGRGAVARVAAALPLGALPAAGRLRHGTRGDGGAARVRAAALARVVGVGDAPGRRAARRGLPPRGRHHHRHGRGVDLSSPAGRPHAGAHRPRVEAGAALAPALSRASRGRRRGDRARLHPPRGLAHAGGHQAPPGRRL
ncbi:MAG: hypothetical protein AVDCRST_MAG89-2425, partial [uncultured Gemmatimonadetes bacterium]